MYDLNTSHVKVQLQKQADNAIANGDLNTSHVKVQ